MPAASTAQIVNAPIAPGHYRDVTVTAHRKVSYAHSLRCQGPGVLAFDGERERVLKPGQTATLRLERGGPWVVDVPTTMKLAAERGCFTRPVAA